MKRFARVLSQLPLATALGAFVGLLVALIAAVLSATPLRLTVHPLAPFALAPLPAVLGAWFDWARLWRPSKRTRAWSFALLALTGIAAVQAAVIASDTASSPGAHALLLAPAAPLSAALVVWLGARALMLLGRRGVRVAGFELACGTIRRDERDRLVVDTGDGALEVERTASADLGSNRSIDLSTGANLALLARVKDSVPKADPFRTERRMRATSVLGVASSPKHLAVSVRRRARAWTAYLFLLAFGAAAFATTVAYQPESGCEVGPPLMKTWSSDVGA